MSERPFAIVGLDHVVLRVTDIDRALAFYEGVLGCALERQLPELGLYQLRAGNHLIDLTPIGSKLGGEEPVNQAARNQDHFCLVIDQFDEQALREYLANKGIDVPEAGDRYGAEGTGPSVYISDPDGNTVELKGKLQKG
jgi:catechol 2,3-dioxygenase-like lactoylglutathione lyase family enzyme